MAAHALDEVTKSELVNWLPWSVLTISGVPYRPIASSSASTQKSAVSVFESLQDRILRVVQFVGLRRSLTSS